MLLVLVYAGNLFGAASSSSTASSHFPYQDNTPFYYAVLAEAAYKSSKSEAQKVIGRYKCKATVIDRKSFVSRYGSTNLLLVKDANGDLHIAVEGTNSLRNWRGNILMPVRGYVKEFDVPADIRNAMHKIFKAWGARGSLVSIIGHSQGGMYASQVVASREKKYPDTQVITFNGFKIKSGKNQLHLANPAESASTLCSPKHRYVFTGRGGAHWRVVSNHRMAYFLDWLPDKTWKRVLRHGSR